MYKKVGKQSIFDKPQQKYFSTSNVLALFRTIPHSALFRLSADHGVIIGTYHIKLKFSYQKIYTLTMFIHYESYA